MAAKVLARGDEGVERVFLTVGGDAGRGDNIGDDLGLRRGELLSLILLGGGLVKTLIEVCAFGGET
jgi:hypothetical protein